MAYNMNCSVECGRYGKSRGWVGCMTCAKARLGEAGELALAEFKMIRCSCSYRTSGVCEISECYSQIIMPLVGVNIDKVTIPLIVGDKDSVLRTAIDIFRGIDKSENVYVILFGLSSTENCLIYTAPKMTLSNGKKVVTSFMFNPQQADIISIEPEIDDEFSIGLWQLAIIPVSEIVEADVTIYRYRFESSLLEKCEPGKPSNITEFTAIVPLQARLELRNTACDINEEPEIMYRKKLFVATVTEEAEALVL